MSPDGSDGRSATFAALLDAWNDGPTERFLELISDDYVGHMLHLAGGERTAQEYPGWIRRYRATSPGVLFVVAEQSPVADRLWTRLEARLPDGRSAQGMNVSRFVGDLIAEEWAVWSPWLP